MAIFNNTTFTPEVDNENYAEMYPYIMPTVEAGYEIAAEGYGDMIRLIEGLYVSDIMIETAVHEGATNVDVLVEGAVKDFFKKIIDKLIEWKNKIIAWFKRFVENMKIRFTSYKDFINKYEDKLKAKTSMKGANNFEAEVVHFNKINPAELGVKYIDKVKVEAFDLIRNSSEDGSDLLKKVLKVTDLKSENIGDFKDRFVKDTLVTDGKPVKASPTIINDFINQAKKFDENINKLKECESITTKTIDGLIKSAQEAATNAEKSNGSNDAENASKAKAKAAKYSSIVSLIQQINTIASDCVNRGTNGIIGYLRGFLLYKPAKESFGGEELLGDSIFESALNLL